MSPLATLLRHELRLLMRDTRMVVIAIGVPLVVFPVLIFVLRAVERNETRRLDETVHRYAVTGSSADEARALVARALALTDEPSGARFDELHPVDPESALASGELQLVVEGRPPEDQTDASPPELLLHYRAESDFSRASVELFEARLDDLAEQRRDSAFTAAGFPVPTNGVARIEARNMASGAREGRAALGLVLTPFVLLLMLTGGSIAAVDTLSGERERGTLETLLTTGLNRRDVVRGKLLAIVMVGLVLVFVNAANLLVYLGLGVLELPEHLALSVDPWDTLLVLFLLAPLTVLVASALLLLSGWVDGYRNFQIAFFPVLLGFIALALPGLLPGMQLRSAIALVPVAGIGMAVREVSVGEYDWLFLALAWSSTAAAGALLVRLTERALSTERLVTGASTESEYRGGATVFPYRVLRWFAAIWAVFFLSALWFGEPLGVRGQVLLNLVVLFGGGSFLMIRVYRLDLRRVLSLRAPPPGVWGAVLVGAPAGYVTALGLARFVDAYLLPMPTGTFEAFGEELFATLPLWQLMLFLAVMPAVFEEIAFRGVLLHGLRSRLEPAATCLAVGALFGIFHVSLFRILPTAYLGVLLAATVLLTGSIYPAMLWHFLNNAVGIVPAHLGWIDETTRIPVWGYVVAVAALAGALWTLQRAARKRGTRDPGHPLTHDRLSVRSIRRS